jgi:hypothetical protein
VAHCNEQYTRTPPEWLQKNCEEKTVVALGLILHERLQVTILLFMLAMGGWGLWNYIRKKPLTPGYQGALVIGEVLIVIEAVIGLLLLPRYYTLLPRSDIHILYGITAVLAIPGAFAYLRGRDSRWESLVYAAVCFFLAGLSLRLQFIATTVVGV